MFTAIKGTGLFWQQSMLAALHVSKSPMIPDWIYNLAWDEWYMIYGALVLIYNTVARYVYPFILQVDLLLIITVHNMY